MKRSEIEDVPPGINQDESPWSRIEMPRLYSQKSILKPEQELANFFWTRPDSKYFQPGRPDGL